MLTRKNIQPAGIEPTTTPAKNNCAAYIESLLTVSSTRDGLGGTQKSSRAKWSSPPAHSTPLLEEVARPLHRELADIVRQLLGSESTDDNAVRLGALSVMGQCVYYHYARTVLKRSIPDKAMTPTI